MYGNQMSVIYGTHYPNKLFVGCLPSETKPEDLGRFFSKYGQVLEAKIVYDNQGRSKKFGFITFRNSENVDELIKFGSMVFQGKMINIGPAVKKNLDVDSQSNTGTNTATPKQSHVHVGPLKQSVEPLYTPKTVVLPSPHKVTEYPDLCGSDGEPWKCNRNVWGISNKTQSIWKPSDNSKYAHRGGSMASGHQILNADQASQYASNFATAAWTLDAFEYYGLPGLTKQSAIGQPVHSYHRSSALPRFEDVTETTSPQ